MKKKNIAFIVLSCILIVIFSISLCPIRLQNDTFYTVKIGEYIIQNGIGVLHDGMDPFSWHTDLPYTFPHWAYDVFIYGIYNLGGFLGIDISTVVLACVLGLSVFFVNNKITKNALTSFIITLSVMYFLNGYIAARAQLVTFILFIWTIYFIEKFIETKRIGYAIPLIVIPIIIANVHLAVFPFYFILFLPAIGEYVVAHILDLDTYFRKWRYKKLNKKLQKGQLSAETKNELEEKIKKYEAVMENKELSKKRRRENPYKIRIEKNKNVLLLILIFVICIFTGFLTPLGDTPYTYLIHTLEGNTMNSISEHLPLTLINAKDVMCLIVVYIAILIFTDTKIKLRDLFMVAGLLFMAFSTRRQVSMFALIGSISLNRLVCSFLNKYDPNGCEKMERLSVKMPGVIITICIVLVMSLYMAKPKVNEKIINESSYPVAAADYILENLDIKNIKLYNEYNYGSYLLYRGIPVFIDSRADLYAPEFNGNRDIFSDFINISSINTYYEDKFKEYGITHVLMYKNAKLNMFISRNTDNYKELYSDDHFILYERLMD